MVVVGELFALPDHARRANPARAVNDVNVTIRPARMIDEPGIVAADARVDHRPVRQLEAPDVTLADITPLAPQAFLVGNLFPEIGDDAFVLRNRVCREHTPALNPRPPLLNHSV